MDLSVELAHLMHRGTTPIIFRILTVIYVLHFLELTRRTLELACFLAFEP